MQNYDVLLSRQFHKDLRIISRHLYKSYRDILLDSPEEALDRMQLRIGEASAYAKSFTTYPHRGTENPQISAGLRSITHRDFTYYFRIDEEKNRVSILAVFFTTEDHKEKMADRLHR